MKLVSIGVAALAFLAVAPTGAETVFRCGNEYSSVACRDAKTLVIAAAVTDEQRAEARQVAAREKLLAAEMVRDRREREAALKPARAGSLSAAPRVAELAKAIKKRPNRHRKSALPDDERDFIAAVPKAIKPKS